MLILRTKNRSNNSVAYFSWLVWSPDNITFSTSWWLSQHCCEEGYLQKYLKASSVFPKAGHGSISVDFSSVVMDLHLDLVGQGFAVIGIACPSVSWPASAARSHFYLVLVFIAWIVAWDVSNTQKARPANHSHGGREQGGFKQERMSEKGLI